MVLSENNRVALPKQFQFERYANSGRGTAYTDWGFFPLFRPSNNMPEYYFRLEHSRLLPQQFKTH